MTRKLLALLIPLLLLTNVAIVKAETPVTDNVRTTTTGATTAAGTKPNITAKMLMDQRKTEITKIKDDATAMIQAKRVEFNTKLQTIRDQNKKALVERINSRLAEINKNQTTKYTEILSQLQTFLDKISSSATPTASLAKITNAQNVINTAKSAVTAQSEKAYIMTIADDTTLRQNAGAIVSQFRQDIISVYKLVVNARLAVLNLKPVISPIIMKPIIRKFATGSAK